MSFEFREKAEAVETPFDRQARIGWWRQDVLREARVMVIGAGALGNEVLKNLVLLGVGRILVVDFDTISISNLSRTVLFRPEDIGKRKAPVAAARATEMALETTSVVTALDADIVWELGLGIYRRMDVILGCVDNDEARLSMNRAARSVGKPWINGGIFELSGSVTTYGDTGACFECTVTPDQIADAQSRYDSCEQVKKRYVAEERMPTVQVTSALVSALQAQEAVKILHGEPVAYGARLAYNGATHGFHRITLPPDDHCLAHGRFEDIIELDCSALETMVGELLDVLESRFGEGVRVELGSRFIRRIRCRNCGNWIAFDRPAHRIFDDELNCGRCHEPADGSEGLPEAGGSDYVEAVTGFSRGNFGGEPVSNKIASLYLWDVGIPPLHILNVADASGNRFACELTRDLKTVFSESWGFSPHS